MQEEHIRKTVIRLVSQTLSDMNIQIVPEDLNEVPISVSGRHLHLSRQDMDALFGKGYELSPLKPISQPGQFASNERVTIEGPNGKIENLRVLGPLREETQIELAASDARRIGLHLPVRASGNLKGTPGAVITGPAGRITVPKGLMIAERHIHMTKGQAARRKLTHGQKISVKIDGVRGGILENVYVRVSDDYAYDMHIDGDEANAFLIGPETRGSMLL